MNLPKFDLVLLQVEFILSNSHLNLDLPEQRSPVELLLKLCPICSQSSFSSAFSSVKYSMYPIIDGDRALDREGELKSLVS